MSQHVDVVWNEWAAGRQSVVARVTLQGGKVSVESPDPKTWREVVLRPLRDPKSGAVITADGEPDQFVAALAEQLHGSHLFATEPHDEQTCPFPDQQQTRIETGVPIPPLSRSRRRAAVHARAKRAS